MIDPSNTILDGGGSGITLYVRNEDYGGDAFIQGFTVRNGKAGDAGGGMNARSISRYDSLGAGNVTLKNNIVTGNTAGGIGGGICARSYSWSGPARNVTITDNIISDNTGTSGGGVNTLSHSHL
ncbi:hypothetical protein AMJ44_12330 [candidate division WOR-1 bacterium DG_54_3]|uniref:Right handed beta helix domain-containing protein n=1 Tax=candidate division WOR-1 bacterium DG_54_3 TaxID=1703775 RepID=A0A0S7XRJ7_UNCSA|nr:MAG: hypothetical protein AMJ44_12330 [candidate division WOR-1 bacterium DG_54_3]